MYHGGDKEEVCLDLAKMSMTPHASNNMTPLQGYPKVVTPERVNNVAIYLLLSYLISKFVYILLHVDEEHQLRQFKKLIPPNIIRRCCLQISNLKLMHIGYEPPRY
jgi:hypothetical protein